MVSCLLTPEAPNPTKLQFRAIFPGNPSAVALGNSGQLDNAASSKGHSAGPALGLAHPPSPAANQKLCQGRSAHAKTPAAHPSGTRSLGRSIQGPSPSKTGPSSAHQARNLHRRCSLIRRLYRRPLSQATDHKVNHTSRSSTGNAMDSSPHYCHECGRLPALAGLPVLPP